VPADDDSFDPAQRENGCRVVVTGGPGGGKTTAADLFRRELGEDVVIVPEAATLLFSGGFPRYTDPDAVCAAQRAIYAVQRNLEDTQSAHFAGRILICDRGTVDGAVYWPQDAPMTFFEAVGTTVEKEMARYDAVIFFESAAVGGISIEGGNPIRRESVKAAVEIDRRLRDLWSQHPHFLFIPHNASFFKKVASGLVALESVVAQLRRMM
jgi:predicted ATPase